VLFTSVASAAALFVAVSLGWYQNRPYDLASLHEAVEWVDQGQPVARFDPGATPTPAALQSWLSRNGVSTPVPARLRIRHLAGACIVNVSGRKVALLELRDVTSLTRVFLLERRYFSEGLRQQLYHRDNVVSYVVADDAESSSLGWMIVDQGTPNQFVDGDMPDSGL
jgi:hypothetical protein